MGDYLANQLKTLSQAKQLGADRGIGLLRTLELNAERGSAVVTYARDELAGTPGWENTGPLLNSPRPACLRFMPALNVSRTEIDQMIDGLRITLEQT